MTENITDTLAQRGSTYGDFREQGRITQNLKRAAHDSPNWHKIPAYMAEGIEMVLHKIARILNGNPLYDDNLHDIVGYTKLMQDRAAQDRDSGVVIEGGGDPLYPAYEHEQKPQGDDFTITGFKIDLQDEGDIHHVELESRHNIIEPPLEPVNAFEYPQTVRRAKSILDSVLHNKRTEVKLDARDFHNLVVLAERGLPCE